jgi:hypothetical protein
MGKNASVLRGWYPEPAKTTWKEKLAGSTLLLTGQGEIQRSYPLLVVFVAAAA